MSFVSFVLILTNSSHVELYCIMVVAFFFFFGRGRQEELFKFQKIHNMEISFFKPLLAYIKNKSGISIRVVARCSSKSSNNIPND